MNNKCLAVLTLPKRRLFQLNETSLAMSSSLSGPGGLVRSLPSPADAQTEAAKLSVNRILQAVMAMPPKASPKSAAEQATELSPEVVSLLIVALCQMLQTLVREVEIEREQMLDAQSALTDVLQRVVAQDASWTQ